MIRRSLHSKRAVTLTELLVVLAIIALLATIAVPVYIQQLQRAKIAVAQVEVREIAEAMQQVAATHGFLVPIHVLNNIPTPTGATGGLFGTPAGNRDDMQNLNRSALGIIDINVPLFRQIGASQLRLDSSNDRVVRMVENWQGPFLNPKRIRYAGEVAGQPGTGTFWEDIVVDPWGNPYRVYSPFGMLGSDTRTPVQSNFQVTRGMDDMLFTNFESGRFDRFAIVSYGPDGDSSYTNNPIFQGDDIYYKFSIGILTESLYDVF